MISNRKLPIRTAAILAVVATVVLAGTTSVYAVAPMVKTSAPGYYRMMLGDFEITALSDGTVNLPVKDLLTNTSPAATEKALAKSYLKSPPRPTRSSKFALLSITGAVLPEFSATCCATTSSSFANGGRRPLTFTSMPSSRKRTSNFCSIQAPTVSKASMREPSAVTDLLASMRTVSTLRSMALTPRAVQQSDNASSFDVGWAMAASSVDAAFIGNQSVSRTPTIVCA